MNDPEISEDGWFMLTTLAAIERASNRTIFTCFREHGWSDDRIKNTLKELHDAGVIDHIPNFHKVLN